jgi:pyrimidine operon attenuation protein / uracil phosphoribosyltransferase
MIVSNSVSSVPPPQGGSFVPEPGSAATSAGLAPREVLDAPAIQRAVTRMAHEIIERNQGADGVVLVGLIKGGVWLAEALAAALANLGSPVPVGAIDVSFFRDDLNLRAVTPSKSSLDFELHDAIVVLVDDVLFTGRTVRAALDALREYGRPRSVQLAVMVDRGHRELPIRPDFVGKNLPTSRSEQVSATIAGVVIQ